MSSDPERRKDEGRLEAGRARTAGETLRPALS